MGSRLVVAIALLAITLPLCFSGDPFLLDCSTAETPCNIPTSFCDFNKICRNNTCVNHKQFGCPNDTAVLVGVQCADPAFTDCAVSAGGFLCNIGPATSEISCNVSRPRVDGTVVFSSASSVAFANGPVSAVSTSEASVGPDPSRMPLASDLGDEIKALANQSTPKSLLSDKGQLSGVLQQVVGALTSKAPPLPLPLPSPPPALASAPALADPAPPPAAPRPLLNALRNAGQALAGGNAAAGAPTAQRVNWTAVFANRPAPLRAANLPQLQEMVTQLQALAQNQQATAMLQQFLQSAAAQQLLQALVALAADPSGLDALLALLQSPEIYQAAVNAANTGLAPLLQAVNAASPTNLTVSLVSALGLGLNALPNLSASLAQLAVAGGVTGNATAFSAAIVSLAAQGTTIAVLLLPLAASALASVATTALGVVTVLLGGDAGLIRPANALLQFAQAQQALPTVLQLSANPSVAAGLTGLAKQPKALAALVDAARTKVAGADAPRIPPTGLLKVLLQALQAGGAR